MEGCIAPSEVPGVSSNERSKFGKIAEDLIYMDFCRKYSYPNVYVDDNNPSTYLFFLKKHNPQISLYNFIGTVTTASLGMKRPDILIHAFTEKTYYEIKPNSITGKRDGINKVGVLSASYKYFKLPYRPGLSYIQSEIIVASIPGQLTVRLKSKLEGPGLILYQLCLDCNGVLSAETLAALLLFVIKKMNAQAGSRSFKPIDLSPTIAREGELASLARTLGLVMAARSATIGWKFFWKAVIKRFAVCGSAAAALAIADGPLPVGDLLAVGLTLWTVIDVIRYSNTLWADAANLAREQTRI